MRKRGLHSGAIVLVRPSVSSVQRRRPTPTPNKSPASWRR